MVLVHTEDITRGDWIGARLGDRSTIAGVLPRGFEAYARVFHPVEAQLLEWNGDTVRSVRSVQLRWADIAHARGTTAHPLMRWTSILAGYPDPGRGQNGWLYGDPAHGELPLADLAVLADPLSRHTSTPESCIAGLWDGWGWIDVPPDVLTGPRLTLSGRSYLLFECEIRAFTEPDWQARNGWEHLMPSQLWPDDRAWFLASDVDSDSTLIGGSRALIADVLACESLETAEIPADASLEGSH